MADSEPDRERNEGATEGVPVDDPDGTADDAPVFIVLDYLAQGRPDDRQHRSGQSPLAHAIGEADFRLVELSLDSDAEVSFSDRLPEDAEAIERVQDIEYEDLTSTARSELEYVLEDLTERQEDRFVDIYNDAQPLTLRLHQLNLLPGIGEKLRNTILDERKRSPFGSLADVEERVAGLHDPRGVLVDRVLEELREEDLKYRMFVRQE
jgi:putative nucleotide binding protein